MTDKIRLLFSGDNIYSYDGHKYCIYFPYNWVLNTKCGTGPKECDYCNEYGKLNGVFIGYCEDCATYAYDYERGHGFINGIERIDIEKKDTAASNTYLKHIEIMNTYNYQYQDKRKYSISEETIRSISSDSSSSSPLCDLFLINYKK